MGETATESIDDDAETARFSLESVLAVFRARSDPARPLTANDVMEELSCSRRTAHNKLNALVDEGVLATRKVGARGRVWWIPFEELVVDATLTRAERDPSVELEIERADLPGSGETLERRREALRAAYDYLSENPNTSTTAFLEEVFPAHPAGYETADTWWAAIKPALEDLPNVDVAEDREHAWHYIGG
ncbi:MAG: ArsR family transcriptional regulator [Haloarculaceae archaeon]